MQTLFHSTLKKLSEGKYQILILPIIEDNCTACHNETNARPAILKTYDGVIDAINNHALRDEVVSLQMPPPGSPPLSDSEVNIIISWIDCE